jgi:dTDP-4-amino-4,6-dideoxygalactose transaminase
MNIPFSPPFVDDEVIEEVSNTLKSGWITTGPKTKALENEISRISGASNVLCVNSATSGLILGLKWFGIEDGDEVIVPSYTYSATALVVLHLGAIPVMVDVKPDFTIDPDKVRDAIAATDLTDKDPELLMHPYKGVKFGQVDKMTNQNIYAGQLMMQVQNGKFKMVGPLCATQNKPVWPAK